MIFHFFCVQMELEQYTHSHTHTLQNAKKRAGCRRSNTKPTKRRWSGRKILEKYQKRRKAVYFQANEFVLGVDASSEDYILCKAWYCFFFFAAAATALTLLLLLLSLFILILKRPEPGPYKNRIHKIFLSLWRFGVCFSRIFCFVFVM